jgi:hypothetical protein
MLLKPSMPRRQANYVQEGLIIVDLFLLHKRYREQNRSFDERAVRRYRLGSMLPRAYDPNSVRRTTARRGALSWTRPFYNALWCWVVVG